MTILHPHLSYKLSLKGSFHCNKSQSWFTVKYWLALVRQTYKVCLCRTDKSEEQWPLSRSYLGENGTTGVTYFETSVMQPHTGLT